MKQIANKAATKRGNPAWQKGGASPNPAGRPKDGQSWREVIAELSNATVEDIIQMVGEHNDLGRALKAMPKNVQMKYLVTARVMAALMFEPQASLWNGLMDRMEGKVTEPIDVTSGGDKVANINEVYASVIHKLGLTEQPAEDSTDKEPKPE